MNTQRLDELLENCTLRINVNGIQGTGFFVAPGLILTCAHVIPQGNSTSIKIFWKVTRENFSVNIQAIERDEHIDLALLKINRNISEHPCVLFDKSIPKLNDELFTFGYPFDRTEKYIEGESVTVEHEGKSYKENGSLFLKLKGGQIKKGISGSPLLNLRTKGVCGIIVLSRNTSNDLGGRAIPTSIIFSTFPDLENISESFHNKNNIWKNLITIKPQHSLNKSQKEIINNLSFISEQAYSVSNWEKVIEVGNKILEIDPRHQPTRSRTAQAYNSRSLISFKEGDYDTAILDCSHAIELAPKAEYYWQRGRNYYKLKNFNAAILDCDRAISLKKKSRYYFTRGHAYNSNNNYEKALKDAKYAIQLYPRQAEYYELYAIAYMNMGKFLLAIKKLDQAIKYNSSEPIYYYRIGICYIKISDHKKAIASLNTAITPNISLKLDSLILSNCYYWLTISYSAEYSYKKAIDHINMAIHLNPDNSFCYYQRGWIYHQLGLYKLAIDDSYKAISIDSNHSSFYKLLEMSKTAINMQY